MFMKQRILSFFLIMLFSVAYSQKEKKEIINDTLQAKASLIFEENFEKGLDNWNMEQMPGGIVTNTDGKLEITDMAGCTIWYKKQLEGPIMIQYEAYVIDEGGPQDRVSDLNCFWMAQDLENPSDLFANSENRGGKFNNYDSLRLYYMGVGGHDNSKTRFRRYLGNGDRPLLPEHDLSEQKYLIVPNKVIKIKIIAYNGIIQYYRDGECIIDFYDPEPYTSGYFGFRSVNNHMTIDNFQVFQLSGAE
ncbi:farnesoic acid O-methyltransferase [Arenibacter echinorum]|uniref:Farnesoic acid O-methyltransferase n=2 Tax=Arenibacter echinorum TaxID=440515 RepID=A0A327RD00_9FLAO|nr:farnesoic acid O-methyltransferase [Arenibacter echinorum]